MQFAIQANDVTPDSHPALADLDLCIIECQHGRAAGAEAEEGGAG